MISISEDFKAKQPDVAEFCGIINQALERCPDMTLAEFAKEIESVHRQIRYERLKAVVARQLGEEENVTSQERKS